MRIPMCARERVFRVIKREEWGWWIGLALATKDRPKILHHGALAGACLAHEALAGGFRVERFSVLHVWGWGVPLKSLRRAWVGKGPRRKSARPKFPSKLEPHLDQS